MVSLRKIFGYLTDYKRKLPKANPMLSHKH